MLAIIFLVAFASLTAFMLWNLRALFMNDVTLNECRLLILAAKILSSKAICEGRDWTCYFREYSKVGYEKWHRARMFFRDPTKLNSGPVWDEILIEAGMKERESK